MLSVYDSEEVVVLNFVTSVDQTVYGLSQYLTSSQSKSAAHAIVSGFGNRKSIDIRLLSSYRSRKPIDICLLSDYRNQSIINRYPSLTTVINQYLQELTGAPVMLLPIGANDDMAHSQNEKINVANLVKVR